MDKKHKLSPLNYYEILGIDRGSTTLDVKKQYEKLKTIYVAENPLMRSLFDKEGLFLYNRLIDTVYECLMDPDIRKEYDMDIDKNLESLLLSFPEQFNVRETVKKYYKQKKTEPRLVKRDIYGREADLKTEKIEEIEEHDLDQIFEKYIDQIIDGEVLSKIREEAGISTKTISEYTKISRYIIQAIEDNNYTNLPAEIYVKGFLNNYCKALRLSPEHITRVLEDYIDEMRKPQSFDSDIIE